jgi:hypothetical protein
MISVVVLRRKLRLLFILTSNAVSSSKCKWVVCSILLSQQRCETVSFNDFVASNGYAGAKVSLIQKYLAFINFFITLGEGSVEAWRKRIHRSRRGCAPLQVQRVKSTYLKTRALLREAFTSYWFYYKFWNGVDISGTDIAYTSNCPSFVVSHSWKRPFTSGTSKLVPSGPRSAISVSCCKLLGSFKLISVTYSDS